VIRDFAAVKTGADEGEGLAASAVSRRDLLWLSLLFGAGLAVRLALVAATSGLELYGDQKVYFAEAAQILAGERTAGYRGPGYPAFVAACQWLMGEGAMAARVGNALAGGLLIPVFWASMRSIFSPRAAWLGAGVLAFYPRSVFMPVYLFAENTYCLLLLFGIWMAVRATEDGSRAKCLAAGVAFGLGALTREMLLYFVPVVAIVMLLSSRLATRDRVLRTALFVAATAAVVLPWTIRNYSVHQQLVWVGFSDGVPWFEGNYVAETPLAVSRKRVELANRYIAEADRAGVEGADRKDKIMNDRLKEDAWKAIRERQPAWIFEKIAYNVPRILRPNVRNEVLLGKWPISPEQQKQRSRLLLFTVFLPVHVLLLLLGSIGLAHWRVASPGFLPVLYLCFSFLVHIVTNAAHFRFEYPYEWVLIAGAAATLDRGLPRTTVRRLVAIALVGIAIVSQLEIPDIWRSGFN